MIVLAELFWIGSACMYKTKIEFDLVSHVQRLVTVRFTSTGEMYIPGVVTRRSVQLNWLKWALCDGLFSSIAHEIGEVDWTFAPIYCRPWCNYTLEYPVVQSKTRYKKMGSN